MATVAAVRRWHSRCILARQHEPESGLTGDAADWSRHRARAVLAPSAAFFWRRTVSDRQTGTSLDESRVVGCARPHHGPCERLRFAAERARGHQAAGGYPPALGKRGSDRTQPGGGRTHAAQPAGVTDR